MNVFLIFLVFFVSVLGSLLEIKNKKNYIVVYCVVVVLFILLSISRVDNSAYFSDLTSYVRYFRENNDQSFEFGYVTLTKIVRFLFGANPIYLITVITLIQVVLVTITNLIYKASSSNKSNVYYFNTIFLIYFVYWGTVFSTELLRSGLAITSSFFALILLLRKKVFLSTLLFIISISFHYQQIIFIIFLLSFYKLANFIKLNRQFFLIWLLFILFVDILIYISELNLIVFFSDLFISAFRPFPTFDSISTRLEIYSSLTIVYRNFFSTQYVFYRLVAFILVLIYNDNNYSRIAFSLYFIGLTLSSIFQYFIVFGRIQNLFTPMIILIFITWIRNNNVTITKFLFILFYSFIQLIMMYRYLVLFN